ncbi:non-ribosomal peptide synthetase, partial [Actinomadura logoneensis]
MAAHAARPGAGGLTPADLPLVAVRQSEIDTWEQRYPGLADAWPLTPLQPGLLYQSALTGDGYDPYHVQLVFELAGPVDPARLRAAGQALLDRHPNLRTAFTGGASGDGIQLVVDGLALPWRDLDLRDRTAPDRDAALRAFLAADLADHFDPEVPPLLRMALVRTAPDASLLVLTSHHVLFDGWSVPLLTRELLALYRAGGAADALPRPPEYRDFLVWLADRDASASARAWADELDGVAEPTLLVPGLPADADRSGARRAEVPLTADLAAALPRRAAELG